MNPLDFIIVAIIAYNIFSGLRQGAIRMISGLIGITIAVVSSKPVFEGSFESILTILPFLASYPFIYYGLCFLGILVAVQLISKGVHTLFNWTGLGIINIFFGVILGITRGLALSLIMVLPLVFLDSSLAAHSMVVQESKPFIDLMMTYILNAGFFDEVSQSLHSSEIPALNSLE